MIAGKYSNAEVGRRNLEILAAATLEATLLERTGRSRPRDDCLAAMEELSDDAFRAYRALVYETEGFDALLPRIHGAGRDRQPQHRQPSGVASKKHGAIEDLRAIPWVFSWAQCRLMLPGWYGFGAAVKAWIAAQPEDGMATLQAMHDGWPFFRTRARRTWTWCWPRATSRIASRYAELVDRRAAARADLRPASPGMAGVDRRGARRSRGSRSLLESNPSLARSIRNRFPYIDPLNHVQIELLRRHRAGDTDPRVVQGIHLSINGIAAGLRNSG